MLARAQVVKLLKEFSTLLELLDEDEFRARAFANAARQLDSVGDSMEILIEAGRLSTVRGIGSALAATIREAATTGTFADLEKARARVPQGVLELLRVEGLGPKKARALWRDANILSLADLEFAIEQGSLVKLSGFGGKTLDKFRASIEFIKATGSRRLRHHAKRAAREIEEALRRIPSVLSIHFCGSLCRGMETVGDLDCVVCASGIEQVRTAIIALPNISWSDISGRVLMGREHGGMEVELSVCAPQELPHRLLLATGSKSHLAQLKKLATARGLALDDRGLCRSDAPIQASTEVDLYAALGLHSVPPALREENTYLHTLDEPDYPRALTRSDLRGIIHVHSNYSDGHHTLRELAEAMIGRGYEYLGIADHSQAAAYARGLAPERVKEQWREIDHLNSELAPFRILKGTECDILPDGTLDFADEQLSQFDFVVASVHSGFQMSEEAATDRLCRALENPQVDILGHPTGRLLLKREGYAINHERVIACAAQYGKAIELNSHPQRLDLDWRWISLAMESGVPVPIDPDAHEIDGLDDIEYGLDVAAKAPLSAAFCPSSWTADEFLDWCRKHKLPHA